MAVSVRNPDFYTVPYIHYYEEDVQWSTANKNLEREEIFKANLNSMLIDYKRSLDKTMQVYKKMPDGSFQKLNVFEQLDDSFIQELFETWASDVNEMVNNSSVWQGRIANMNSALNGLFDYSKAVFGVGSFANKRTTEKHWERFFKGIDDLAKVFGGIQSGEEWTEYKLAYREAVKAKGVTARLDAATEALIKNGLIIEDGLEKGNELLSKVLTVISQWPDLFETKQDISKTLSAQLRNYTSRDIGEYLSEALVQGLLKCDSDINDAWKTGKGTGGARLTGKESIKNAQGKSRPRKSDVVKGIGATVTLSGSSPHAGEYIITGEMGINVKWYQTTVAGKMPGFTRENISLENVPANSFMFYLRQCFANASHNYAILNTLAFNSLSKGEGNEYQKHNFRMMYQTVAAKMFSQFLSGLQTEGNSMAILMVNGRMYPIFSIIIEYMKHIESISFKDILNQHSKDGPFIVRISGGDKMYKYNQKEWQGTPYIKNTTMAWERARKVADFKDTITVSFKLNREMLPRLAERLNVKPIGLSSKK